MCDHKWTHAIGKQQLKQVKSGSSSLSGHNQGAVAEVDAIMGAVSEVDTIRKQHLIVSQSQTHTCEGLAS